MPGIGSPLYTSPIPVVNTTTIKAVAVKSGMTTGTVASATFTITTPGIVATLTFSPAAGTFASAQTVAISSTTTGAEIYYTTDGSEPGVGSALYTSPIVVGATTTIKAIAVKSGMNDRAVASVDYVIALESSADKVLTNNKAADGGSGGCGLGSGGALGLIFAALIGFDLCTRKFDHR